MKYLILLIAIPTVFGDLAAVKQKLWDAEDQCFPHHPSVNRDFVEGIKSSRKLPDSPTQDFKCFVHCVGDKMDLILADGTHNHDGLVALTMDLTQGSLTLEEAHAMVTKCISDHTDTCEKAWNYLTCKMEELKDIDMS